MRTYSNFIDFKTELKFIKCNMCGELIEKNEFGYFKEHLSIQKKWEFSSEFDGQTHSIDLCQSCYKKLYESLTLKP